MSHINFMAREINCKIVYYGPGLGGKTTNLQQLYQRADPAKRGKLISLATETERSLFFDFVPQSLAGAIRGFSIRLHLYTVPGPVFYDASRKLVLKGCDAIIYVADSQESRAEANLEMLENLVRNVEEHGMKLESLPMVFQYNKRDLVDIMPVDRMERDLNPRGLPSFVASAARGWGVVEPLKAVSDLLIQELTKGAEKK